MAKSEYEKISVVIPSLHTKEEKKEFIEMLEKTSDYPLDIFFVEKNTKGLTEVYENYLDESPNDIIVYIHDDIEFLKNGWGKEIVSLFTKYPKYGVIGVAGTRCFGEDIKMNWWHNKEASRGMVFHGNSEKSWITIFSPYNLKSPITEVVVVDGLFIACERERLAYGFDEDLKGFHFYDIDFCLSNFLSRECKIGVTDRICIRHNSVGNINEEWKKNAVYVYKKYKNNLPIKLFK